MNRERAVRLYMCCLFLDCQSEVTLGVGTAGRARFHLSKTNSRCSHCISFVFLLCSSIKGLVFYLQFTENHLHINTGNHRIRCDNCQSYFQQDTFCSSPHLDISTYASVVTLKKNNNQLMQNHQRLLTVLGPGVE